MSAGKVCTKSEFPFLEKIKCVCVCVFAGQASIFFFSCSAGVNNGKRVSFILTRYFILKFCKIARGKGGCPVGHFLFAVLPVRMKDTGKKKWEKNLDVKFLLRRRKRTY